MNKEELYYLVLSKLRLPLICLTGMYFVSALGFILIPGITDTGETYHMSIFNAIYVTAYTTTTVGFGEIPYPWTEYQRLWGSFVTVFGVSLWIFSIGQIIVLMQNKHIQYKFNMIRFKRELNLMKSDFYIVCGYGNTGKKLVELMGKHGKKLVVVEKDEDTLESINFSNFHNNILYLCSDLTNLEQLKHAGIESPFCKAIILTTNDDNANTQIALSTKILNKNTKVISRVSSAESYRNMKSFGIEHIVSPTKLFINMIENKLNDPCFQNIENILTGETLTQNHLEISRDQWLVVGYNRYGVSVMKKAKNMGIVCNIVGENISDEKASENSHYVKGKGLDDIDLTQGDIKNAHLLIITNDDDFHNLSTILTARNLNPSIKIICIVNQSENIELFETVNVQLIFQPYENIIRVIFSNLSEPLLSKYLKLVKFSTLENKQKVASKLKRIDRLNGVVFSMTINKEVTPAIYHYLNKGHHVCIQDLITDSECIEPLMKRSECDVHAPLSWSDPIELNTTLLFYSSEEQKRAIEWALCNHVVLSNRMRGLSCK
jgi:Trk K+ transport system NAD-binding subunit